MYDPLTKLTDLATECLVKVGDDLRANPDDGGSGFWIAPGMVLTCAHVVRGGRGAIVDVFWNGQVLRGAVADHTPDRQEALVWSFPDLAVIEVLDAPSHPCVWMMESPPRTDLAAFGHSATLGEGLKQVSLRGRNGGWKEFGDGVFSLFVDNEIEPGMSGGPVLDPSLGAVCGVTTSTMGEGTKTGYLSPLSALRYFGDQRRAEILNAHDRFHGADRRWSDLRAKLPKPELSSPISVLEEIDLLGILAHLDASPPEKLLALVMSNSSSLRLPEPQPHSLRDVVYNLLDDTAGTAGEVLALIRFTHHLVGSPPRAGYLALHDWATRFATRHDHWDELRRLRTTLTPATTLPGGSIVVEIAYGQAQLDRFRITVSAYPWRQPAQVIYHDKEPVHHLDQIMDIVSASLRTALQLVGGNVQVEFVVPIELFDLPFDELQPVHKFTNLGRKYRVVLRDYDRQENQLVHPDWNDRWHRGRSLVGPPQVIACDDNGTASEFSAELEQHPDTAVVALARRPSSSEQVRELLQVALESGVPVAIWRRDVCDQHDRGESGGPCSGDRFLTAIRPMLHGTPVTELPEQARQMRNRAETRYPLLEDLVCKRTVLLYDDPTRVAHQAAQFREPPYDSPEILR